MSAHGDGWGTPEQGGTPSKEASPSTDAETSNGEPRGGWLTELRLAAGFLTILPVLPRYDAAPEAVEGSLGWFSLIGFAIGGILIFEHLGLSALFGTTLGAALVVLTLTVLTGALHLDALGDTADALGAASDRRRALDIMRDSRIGTFGTVAIVLFLGLEIIALARTSAFGAGRSAAALWLAPGLARWAMAAVSWRIEYLRRGGAGATMLRGGGDRNIALASAIAALAMIPVLSVHALVALAVAIAIAATLRAVYRGWLGGVTGDLIGAAGELVEVAVLLVMASR
jgi:adenosylcobinamide-GDP ribazoletransferase